MKFAYFRKYAINSSYSSQQRKRVSFCWPRSANYFKANDATDRGRFYQVYQSHSCKRNGEEISCLVSFFVWCKGRIELYGKKNDTTVPRESRCFNCSDLSFGTFQKPSYEPHTTCVFADLTDSKVFLSRESKPVDKRNSLNLI